MTHKLLALHLKAFFIQQIAARWNSLDDKSDYIEKEENDRRRYFLEKTTNSLNSMLNHSIHSGPFPAAKTLRVISLGQSEWFLAFWAEFLILDQFELILVILH